MRPHPLRRPLRHHSLRRPSPPRRRAAFATLACAALLLALAGCGSSGTTAGAEKVLRDLFAALHRQDYAQACRDYSPNIQAAMLQAGRRLEASHPTLAAHETCAKAVATIIGLSATTEFSGPLHFTSAQIRHGVATVTFSAPMMVGMVGRSTADLIRSSGTWKVNQVSKPTVASH